MDAIKMLITLILTATQESPKATLFLATLAFLAFMLYGATIIANEGLWMLILYLILAFGALLLLTIIALRFYSS